MAKSWRFTEISGKTMTSCSELIKLLLMGVACRLLLVTHLLPGDVSSDLVAMTTVVLFWPEVSGIKELLLDQSLWQQNTKITQERKQLFTVSVALHVYTHTHTHTHTQEVHRQSLKMEETERKLLDLLAHDKCSHDNHQSSRELLQVNTSCNTAEER